MITFETFLKLVDNDHLKLYISNGLKPTKTIYGWKDSEEFKPYYLKMIDSFGLGSNHSIIVRIREENDK